MAAAVSSVLVGAGIAVSRLAVAEVGPLTLAMLRYAIGGACLLPFAWREARALLAAPPLHSRARDLAGMAAIGILQFGVLIALLNYALQRIGAAEAALIFSLFPLLTMLFAAGAGRERVTPMLLAGVVVSIGGVALSQAPKFGSHGSSDWWGELAVLASAAIGAACSVLYRPYLQRYPTVPVSALAMLASVGLLAIAALPEAWPQRMGAFTGTAWAAIGFVGVSSAVGYFTWLYALKHESPTRVTVFLALNPPAAALCGWLLLGEPVHAAVAGALVLVAAGLWLATRPAPPASR
ncbi:DMT family transporter [Ramlibacter sp. PS4R-6]|uniref:DMT family transporter n=1 Tax=Ramlibacter sp. PS4R-6 TaxID=3133438 RepID=UPI003094C971